MSQELGMGGSTMKFSRFDNHIGLAPLPTEMSGNAYLGDIYKNLRICFFNLFLGSTNFVRAGVGCGYLIPKLVRNFSS